MIIKNIVITNRYFDSVVLMSVASRCSEVEGVEEVTAMMGTDNNKEVLNNTGMLNEEGRAAGPNDLILCVKADNESSAAAAEEYFNKLLNEKKVDDDDTSVSLTSTGSALEYYEESNLVLFSIPGPYIKREAEKCLEAGRNVMIFSDNVSIEEEKYLKELSVEKGLLVMGPDCGTSIINNTAFAFANAVPEGPFALIGASGTGLQEVSTILAKKGYGIKHAIGVGGRDLSKEIGGISMLQALKSLEQDDDIELIILISKPPAAEVEKKIIETAGKSSKKIVINFLKGNPETAEKYKLPFAVSLEDAANLAIAVFEEKEFIKKEFDLPENEIDILAGKLRDKIKGKKYLRGLYSGGTLADEALTLLSKQVGDIYSNIPLKPELQLEDSNVSKCHTIIDMGEDEFTRGRPHPMIDYSVRMQRLIKEAADPETGIILLDIVTGFGSHPEPVVPLTETISKINQSNNGIVIITSICGTEDDPQNVKELKKHLENLNVIIMPTNAQAARFAGRILKG